MSISSRQFGRLTTKFALLMIVRVASSHLRKDNSGANRFTRILVSIKVAARILAKQIKAALGNTYTNCLSLLPFHAPEILAILMMLGEDPLEVSTAFERSGRKATAMKY